MTLQLKNINSFDYNFEYLCLTLLIKTIKLIKFMFSTYSTLKTFWKLDFFLINEDLINSVQYLILIIFVRTIFSKLVFYISGIQYSIVV